MYYVISFLTVWWGTTTTTIGAPVLRLLSKVTKSPHVSCLCGYQMLAWGMFLILSTYLQLLSQFNILIFSSWMDQCILEYRMAPLSNMTWYLAFAFPQKGKSLRNKNVVAWKLHALWPLVKFTALFSWGHWMKDMNKCRYVLLCLCHKGWWNLK